MISSEDDDDEVNLPVFPVCVCVENFAGIGICVEHKLNCYPSQRECPFKIQQFTPTYFPGLLEWRAWGVIAVLVESNHRFCPFIRTQWLRIWFTCLLARWLGKLNLIFQYVHVSLVVAMQNFCGEKHEFKNIFFNLHLHLQLVLKTDFYSNSIDSSFEKFACSSWTSMVFFKESLRVVKSKKKVQVPQGQTSDRPKETGKATNDSNN